MKEKIELVTKDFDEKEKKKITKFMSSLTFSTLEELDDLLELLEQNRILINKANQLKVLVNTVDEVQNKFSVIEQIGEKEFFKEDPNRINLNAIDVYKRITYCKQNNIAYKNEDGTYKDFLCSSTLWNHELELHNMQDKIESIDVEPEPKKTEEVLEIKDDKSKASINETNNESVDYYEKIRAELEETRRALSNEFMNLDVDNDELISFDDVGSIRK